MPPPLKSRRPELPREFVAGHKRRRMMEAIAELTAAQGYEATKIADIVRSAGVARKTLYDNFDGKEDLFLSAVDTTLAEMRMAVEERCGSVEGSWDEAVAAGVEALLLYVAANPAASRMVMIEALSATPTSAARYDAGMRDFVDLLRQGVERGDDLPETLEESLAGGVAWILQQQIRRGEAGRAPELCSELSQFVLSPYLGVVNVADLGRRK
jgi:AcrR family transcriptional regulator